MDFGRFQKATRLGAGGFGEVWKAWDPQVGRWVALKFLTREGPDDLARFRREAQTAAALDHPNVAKVFEVGEAAGNPYIAMEFVDGRSLAGRTIEPRRAAAVIRDAARGVQAAHERGIIHRDLKPANIMIDAGGRVLVMDFGLARSVESGSTMTKSGLMVGTPAYMSPEQARGEIHGTDARSDVYGLGATLYEILAGRPPFDGDSVLTLVMKVVQDDAPMVRSLMPNVAPELDAITQKCLEKDRGRRYATAADLADDLDRFLAGESIAARPESTIRRVLRAASRRTWVRAAAAAVVVVALVGAGLLVRVATASGRASGAERALVEQIREKARTCLEAAVDLRRAGNVAGMEQYAADLERACAEVRAKAPSLAEAPHLLGRMRSEQMRWDDALALQEEAVRLDPSMIDARYERFRLIASRMQERRVAVMQEQLRKEMQRLLLSEGGRAGSRPGDSDAVRRDAQWKALSVRLLDDVAVLGRGPLDAGRAASVRAYAAWAEGRDAEAFERFEEAHAAAPALTGVVEMLAGLHLALGRTDKAVELLTKAADDDVGYWPHADSLAYVWLLTANEMAGKGDDPEPAFAKAEAYWARAIAANPVRGSLRARAGMVWSSRARVAEAKGRDPQAFLDRASADFAAAAERGAAPEAMRYRAAMFANHGAWLAERGRDPSASFERAIADYAAALAAEPGSVDTLISRGFARLSWAGVRIDRGEAAGPQIAEAIADFDAVLAADATVASAFRGKAAARTIEAQMVVGLGKDGTPAYEAALGDYARALEADPADTEIYALRGALRAQRASWLLDAQRDPTSVLDDAERDLGKALEMSPANAECLSRRIEARLWRMIHAFSTAGDWRAPLDGIERDAAVALRVDPAHALVLLRRGQARMIKALAERSLPGAEESLRDFQAGLRANERHLAGWTLYAAALTQAGDLVAGHGGDPGNCWKAAIDAYAKLLELNPTCETAYSMRGDLWRIWGQHALSQQLDPTPAYESGEKDHAAALKLRPDRGDLWLRAATLSFARARFADMLGRADEAAQRYLRAGEEAGEAVRRQSTGAGWRLRGMALSNAAAGGGFAPGVKAERFAQAEESFAQALAIDAADAEALKGRGGVRLNRGDAARQAGDKTALELARAAVADLEGYVKLRPKDAEGWRFLGVAGSNLAICLGLDTKEAAAAARRGADAFEEAVRLEPELEAGLRPEIEKLRAVGKGGGG